MAICLVVVVVVVVDVVVVVVVVVVSLQQEMPCWNKSYIPISFNQKNTPFSTNHNNIKYCTSPSYPRHRGPPPEMRYGPHKKHTDQTVHLKRYSTGSQTGYLPWPVFSGDRPGCTPIPTYPYGKSLYKPYIVGIYGL